MKAVIFTHVLYLILIKTFMVKGVSKCESKVELRAVLLSCPAKDTGCDDDDPLSQAMKSEESQILQVDSKNFESLRADKERGFPTSVKDCKRKLVITLKVKNLGKIPCDDEYIVVDHVFDPVTGGRGRLLSPVVVKLRQEQMVQLYGLQFQRVVNSDPFEEQKTGEKTCSVDPENPTCGIAMYDGKPIPFSEGFCCSCDPHVNEKRQLSPVSRGDSLLYRDSKLISQGNRRFLRQEKSGAIVNPDLVQLKSGSGEENSGSKKGHDCGGISESLLWDKIPNYLLERDRKIVCDRGDFMNELCKLHQHKIETEATSNSNFRRDDVSGTPKKMSDVDIGVTPGVASEEAVSFDPSFTTVAVNSLPEDNASNDLALKNFINALNMDRTTNSVPFSEERSPAMSSRGKRENRRENRKLTLEEKLDRFVNSKKQLTNRRKRLLELSHRRFRKVEERCRNGPENQRLMMKNGPPNEYETASPPRYFFSHDRAIIDPLESIDMMMNATCKSLKESECEDRVYRTRSKSEILDSFRGGKQEKLADRKFYHRQPKSDDKLMTLKGKYLVGSLSNKKDRVSDVEGERLENDMGKGMELTLEDLNAATPSRGEKILSTYKGGRKNEGKDEGVKVKEGKGVIGRVYENDRKGQYASKNVKNFLHKNDLEKKLVKPKIRNFFIAKNREKQKLKSELTKSHRKSEFRHSEGFEGEKRREHLKVISGVGNEEFGGKKLDERGKERESLKDLESLNMGKFSTEKSELGSHKFSLDKVVASEKEGRKGDRKYAQASVEQKQQEGRFHPTKNLEGNVNFNVEIVRNQVPGITKHRHHSEQFMKSRMDAPAMGPKTNIYNLNGKLQHLKSKQNPFLRYGPSQNFYVLENDKTFPQNAFVIRNENGRFAEVKNRPRSEAVSLKSKSQPNYNAYFYRKANRRYHLPVFDYDDDDDDDVEVDEGSAGRPRQPLAPGRGDRLREAEARGKRHSRVGRRSEVAEGVRRPRPEKLRSKRSASYAFQPALGFYESELDTRKPNEYVVHELETCLSEKVRKREPEGWASKFTSFSFTRTTPENSSFDQNILSTLQELQSGLNRPTINKREKIRNSASDKERLIQSYLNAPDYVLEEVETALKGKRRAGDQKKPQGAREGCNTDYGGDSNQDTAHCMRFGDLWYGLYTIKKPVVSQIVGIELFDKHSLCDGTTQWRDLTKGKMIRIGTFFSKAEDELPTMSLTFMGEKSKKVESAIDPDNYYLLIPSHVSDPSKLNSYPQFEGGPGEYLLVQSKDVSSGGECNMIGTSFEAFARQPDRCARRLGSCLKRQPVDLWREDMEARIRGKRGKYFVENFGNVPNSPIKSYTNLTGDFLALEYYGEYTSTIEIEVKADSNAIIRKGSNAQIPLVYIDSTYPRKTRIILSVLNIGLTSSYFRPRLGNCPPDLDPAWCPLEGPLVTIPPQQRHDFKLDLSGTLPGGQIHLMVQVLNQVNKQIASRKITIKKGDRCICAFHCQCNCIGNLVGGRTCRRLPLRDYRKAGYIGSYPFRGGAATSAPESIMGNIHIVLLTASYLLLFLGLLKGILGVFIRRIGIAGTRIVTGPRLLCGYYECELRGCSVLYDEYGFPVHPTTCLPVQIVPIGMWFLLSSLPCCGAFCSDLDGFCRRNEGDGDQKCSRPLLSKEPNSTCVHYNLTTVDSKKSKQEYLPYPAYKGDDDPLEEDDTEFVLQEMKRYRKK